MMPSIKENIGAWGPTHDWKDLGDEWSEPWGGTKYLWHGTIFPRISSCVPADTILEIAPGYGRCTQFFLALCRNLQLVDLNENCIDHCKNRFSAYSHLHYFVNDGKSLEMIRDNSVDFIFSWDSLVHCEADVLDSYIRECARVLKPGGRGFIHHSNIGAYRTFFTGTLRCDNIHWRGETVDARFVDDTCRENGLHCVRQETVNWRGTVQNDCFSLFVKSTANETITKQSFENTRFHEEYERMARIAQFYSR